MPFTISHIAAVLPLKRLPLYFPALVVGALSPDFTYVLEVFGLSFEGHSIFGIVYFCLPVSWVVLLAYENFLKDTWEKLFPWLNYRSSKHRLHIILFSIIIGAATHVIWDSFTHRHGYAVIHLNILQQIVFTAGSYPLTIFKLLQHASSFLGGLAVLFAAYSSAKQSCQGKLLTSKSTLAALITATIFITTVISLPVLLEGENKLKMSRELLAMRLAIRSLAGLGIVAFAYPLLVWAHSKIGGKK